MGNLTGPWFGDDAALYYLVDDDKEVWWAGLSIDGVIENGIRSTSVFRGSYGGGSVNGQWVQVPRGQTTDSGPLSITIENDVNGEAFHLVAKGPRFGSANLWRFHKPPRLENIAILFEHTRRNGHNALNEKVSAYKEPVVVFGNVQLFENRFPAVVQWAPKYGRSYHDFICWKQSSPPDGDINIDIAVDRAQLERQGFWTDHWWAKPPKKIIEKLDRHKNDLQCEILMYGRDARCSDLKPGRPVHKLFPGWQEQNGDSVLIDGMPINGSITFGQAQKKDTTYELVNLGGTVFEIGKRIRVTGAMGIDLGPDHGHNPAEIHPVYAIDVVRGTPQDDLSGVWADDKGGTYYLRQLGSDVWWYCADPSRKRGFTGVFNGTNNAGHVVGEYRDVPIADGMRTETLDLQLDSAKLFLAANGDSVNLVGAGLYKLRDSILGGPIT